MWYSFFVWMPLAYGKIIAAGAKGHHDLFQRTVAGALADAVDGAFDLAGAVQDGRQTVGDRHAQIVVAMSAQHRLIDAADVLLHVREDGAVLLRHG